MSSYPALCALFSISGLISSVTAQGTYSHAPDASSPAGVSLPVDASFAGFGIEPSNLFSFTGHDSTNQLSVNLLQNLADYTGTPPHLRIGGNTQDDMIYNKSYTSYNLMNNPNPTVSGAAFPPDEFIFGPGYFKAIERFPTGTPITFGLNMAYQDSDYASRIIDTASAAQSGLTNTNLTSFEIGNEVDLYAQNGFRNGTWDGTVYTQQWLDRAGIVYQNVLKPASIPADFFEPGCTASTIGTSFTIDLLSQDGITAQSNLSTTPYVARWNQHDYYYYIGVSTYALTLEGFTDLSTTGSQFASWAEQVKEATSEGYRYALREMGVVGPIGMHGITDIFSASLWTLNFFLYAATLNISSVQMHMTDNSNASAWQPVLMYGNQPFVRPNYYAWAAVTQLNGCGGGMQVGGPGVIASGVPSGYSNQVAIYDVYKSDQSLQSMVLINTKIANASDTDKPTLTVELSLPDFIGKDLYLSYLTADGADSQHNATWNGISYEQNDVGKPAVVDSTVQKVTVASNGTASVPVRDSQAVIVNIGQALGSSSACPANSKPTSSATTSSAGLAKSTGGATTTSGPTSSQQKSRADSSMTMHLGSMSCVLVSILSIFAFAALWI